MVTTLVGIEELARGEYKHGGRLIRDLLKDEGDPVKNLQGLVNNNKIAKENKAFEDTIFGENWDPMGTDDDD